MRKRSVMRLGAGVMAVLALAVFELWPGGPVRATVSTFTDSFECWQPTARDDQLRTVALGDSITAGHRNASINVNGNDSYFDVLTCREDSPVGFVANEGVWHETAGQMLDRIDEVLAHDPDLVMLVAGTNDVLHGDPVEAVENIAAIHDHLTNAGVELVVGTIPPSNEEPALTEEYNADLTAWADREGVQVIDFWTPLANPDGTWQEEMNADPWHPSPAGARVMANAAQAALD